MEFLFVADDDILVIINSIKTNASGIDEILIEMINYWLAS